MKKITASQALKVLRTMSRKRSADAVIVVRGRLNQEGTWETDWEGAHWLPELSEENIAPSGLPSGFAQAAASELGGVTAGDVAEEHLGRFGAAIGKGLWESLSGKIASVAEVKEE